MELFDSFVLRTKTCTVLTDTASAPVANDCASRAVFVVYQAPFTTCW
ncbi:MAG: hypothetical protein KGR47_06205 [Acidobacteria bacterium]|nr:hypothetical protein [Acidobacteriota bacterium]